MKNRVTIAISSLFSTFSLIILGRLTTSNVIGLFLAIILGAAFYAIHSWEKDAELFIEQKKRIRIGSGCLAFIFAILMLAGNYQEILALYENKLFQLITISSVAIGIFSLFYFSLKLLLLISCHYYYKDRNNGALLLDSSILARDKARQNKKFLQFKNKRNKAIFLIGCFIILILCWLPYLLMNYPGVMTPDSLWQYEQVVGFKPYSNHHPWIHTLLFKLFYSIGIQLTNNTIHAIAFYTIAQMIVLAAIEIYVLKIMVERNVSKWLVGGALFFYALMPYNALFAVTIWKDILFSGFVLLFVTCSYQMVEAYQKEESLLEYKCPYFLGILAGIAMCLLRSNGWYAFLVTIPFFLISLRKQWGKISIFLGIILGVAIIVKGPIMTSAGVIQPDFVESLSIPLQQMANVVVHDEELNLGDITPAQRAELERYMQYNQIVDAYNPALSDPIKDLVRAGDLEYLEAHKIKFLKLWIGMGIKNPGYYIEAFLDQTRGYWYPQDNGIILYERISPNEIGLQAQPILKGRLVIKINEVMVKLYSILPVVGLLWSVGFYLWLALFLIFNCFVQKRLLSALCFVPNLAIIATLLIATPVAADIRYAYSLVLSMPVLIMIGVHLQHEK